jgi:transcriptional regulator with XRE-family HTH domain
VVKQLYSQRRVEHLIRLVKKGDASSLAQLRQELDKTQKEIASEIGISERRFGRWERGEEEPSGRYYARWRLKLSYYIDDIIAEFLGTKDSEIVTHYWELMWGLVD